MKQQKGKPTSRTRPGKAASRPANRTVSTSAGKSAGKATRGAKGSKRIGRAAGPTSQVTIYLFRTSEGIKIRTAPQRAYAGPGHIEWTVVNLIDGADVPVTISWPNGGPWGKEPISIQSYERRSAAGARVGRYKYVVSALGVEEDPEVEFPESN